MKQEKMTHEERLDALLKGRPLDHVPFFCFSLGFCAKNVGYLVDTIYRDPEKSFQAQIWTKEQYGYDSDPFLFCHCECSVSENFFRSYRLYIK